MLLTDGRANTAFKVTQGRNFQREPTLQAILCLLNRKSQVRLLSGAHTLFSMNQHHQAVFVVNLVRLRS